MADELLSAVIRLENQIQQQLRQEQLRADTWLAGVRKDLEEETRQVLQELATENEQIQTATEQRSKLVAAKLESEEKHYGNKLEKISDQVLLEVLGRQLMRLLPGQIDDHQNVKS